MLLRSYFILVHDYYIFYLQTRIGVQFMSHICLYWFVRWYKECLCFLCLRTVHLHNPHFVLDALNMPAINTLTTIYFYCVIISLTTSALVYSIHFYFFYLQSKSYQFVVFCTNIIFMVSQLSVKAWKVNCLQS